MDKEMKPDAQLKGNGGDTKKYLCQGYGLKDVIDARNAQEARDCAAAMWGKDKKYLITAEEITPASVDNEAAKALDRLSECNHKNDAEYRADIETIRRKLGA